MRQYSYHKRKKKRRWALSSSIGEVISQNKRTAATHWSLNFKSNFTSTSTSSVSGYATSIDYVSSRRGEDRTKLVGTESSFEQGENYFSFSGPIINNVRCSLMNWAKKFVTIYCPKRSWLLHNTYQELWAGRQTCNLGQLKGCRRMEVSPIQCTDGRWEKRPPFQFFSCNFYKRRN